MRDKGCSGACLTAYDIGVPEYGDQIAYPHPSCPVHGDGIKDSDFYPAPGWTQEDEALWQDYCDEREIEAQEAEAAGGLPARYWGGGEWSDGS